MAKKGPGLFALIAVVVLILAALWYSSLYFMPEGFRLKQSNVFGYMQDRPAPYPFGSDTFVDYKDNAPKKDEKKVEKTK
jgi:hypothetical protein